MSVAGLDIGSRTIALVELEAGEMVFGEVRDTTHDPLQQCLDLLRGRSPDRLVATGYGRQLARANFAHEAVTEIKAFALGCHYFFPECRTVLDIGGQDTKAIAVSPAGAVADFQMNDRCAAGTGKFLEVMAMALGLRLQEFGELALRAGASHKISSMCTVFAESEVISLTTQGAARNEVALGIHRAIVSRSVSLLKRIAPPGDVFFAGGVALNGCVRSLLENELGRRIFVPDDPQIVGAVGAALSTV